MKDLNKVQQEVINEYPFQYANKLYSENQVKEIAERYARAKVWEQAKKFEYSKEPTLLYFLFGTVCGFIVGVIWAVKYLM